MSDESVSRRLQNIGSTLVGVSSQLIGVDEKKSESVFGHIPKGPLDPILGTNILFNADTDPRKINLGVGAYRTDEGKPYVLNCVKKAQQAIAADKNRNLEYLPINGDAQFAKLARDLLFGSKSSYLDRIVSFQTLSGTGSLRVAAAFIQTFFPKVLVYYSNPTWGNHNTIFAHCGIPSKPYRYWNAKNKNLDIEGLLQDLQNAPEGSIVLLHACAHNPTGVDPTPNQWKQIAAVMKSKRLLPWFDSAYQGFASGDLDRDAWAIRYFADQGFEMIACQSFAKNFGLYGERIGAMHVLVSSKNKVEDVFSQVNILIRALYSNPPKYGADIVKTILSNPELTKEWKQELVQMSHRIINMRNLLFDKLKELGTPGDWSHMKTQIGMFSFTGLTPPQCEALLKQHHIYLLNSGRISMTGVNSKNVHYLAECIDKVVRTIN